MWIEYLKIRGFGCLKDREYEFSRTGTALVVESNESGKSTLASALFAGLCGFSRRKGKAESIKASDVYKPWDGQDYALEMVVSAGSERYWITRDFRSKIFTVRDAQTNSNVTASFDEDISYQLLGLRGEDFRRIAFISGKTVHSFDASVDLRTRLASIADGTDNSGGADAAIAVLESVKYGTVKPDTALKRLRDGIATKEAKILRLDADFTSARELDEDLNASLDAHKQLKMRLDELDVEYSAARLNDVKTRLRDAQSAANDARILRDEMESLGQYEKFPSASDSHLNAALAKLDERNRNVASCQREIVHIHDQISEINNRIEPLDYLTQAQEEDLHALMAVCEGLKDAEANEKTLRDDIEDRKQRADIAGADITIRRRPALNRPILGIAIGTAVFTAAIVIRFLPETPILASAILGLLGAVIIGISAAMRIRALNEFDALKSESSELNDLCAKLDMAIEQVVDLRKRAKSRLAVLGVVCEDVDPILCLERTTTHLERYLQQKRNLREAKNRLDLCDRDLKNAENEVESQHKLVADILAEAGIDISQGIDECVREWKLAVALKNRFIEIRDVRLPEVGKRLVSKEETDKLMAEEAALGSVPVQTSRSLSDVESDRMAVRGELDNLARRIRDLETRIGGVIERYKSEYTIVKEELSTAKRELRKVSQFDEATRTAYEIMREVSSDTRRKWARVLNARASEILPNLNPDYTDLRFDDELSFTLRKTDNGRVMEPLDIDCRLSTGARDQVYLAARLAICSELSRSNEPIPIILDDPFMAADDERFLSGMRWIVSELSRDNQVIILSCHHSRHQPLMNYDWFSENVRTIEL